MIRSVIQIVLGVSSAWVVALVICSFAYEDRTTRRVAERIGESLHGKSTVGDGDLSLVRGGLELGKLRVWRDDRIGTLSLDVAALRCDLPPLGLALLDRECSELVVDGVRLEVSAAALFKIRRPKRPPLRAQRVVLDDAVLVFAPHAFAPELGRIRIKIDRAIAGPTRFRTPLSFLFALRELRASLELPAGITMHLVYGNGVLGVSGSLFGSTPVTLPVALPVADPADDAEAELAKVVRLGLDLAERLVARRAQDWLRSKLAP